MDRALALAWRGWGRVGANPLVGAVVLRGSGIVGEGFHREFGGPHGEVVALRAAGTRARGATLVVTLEPCAHHGKTPPCTDAIVSAGVSRVVAAAADPDPKAKGGAERLRAAGVEVVIGLRAEDARAQNAAFFHRHSGCDRPFVAVKLATSLDGRIADAARRSQWLTGEAARSFVHWLRAGFDAVAVGAGTVLADDPDLTVRGSLQPLQPPLRVVFDRRAELPYRAKLLRTAREVPTVVMVGSEAEPGAVRRLEEAGAQTAVADGLPAALRVLHSRGVGSLLVEGGGVLAGRLVAAGQVDRLFLFTAPVFLGVDGVPAFAGVPGATLAHARRWRLVGRRSLEQDTMLVLDRPT
jgi:diaminohydroxyphosphoribosylaminopyrimidine deaminase/5-amino-6-(5-phosphoribosylamino)uracil reductase